MFEYLMPLLFTQTHENSLLDRACHDAVRCQIAYAEQNSLPWGISESAFSALDRHHVYQYRAFGVPELALKRGQERDFVVAPYASALALSVEPAPATKNLRRLALLGDSAMLGDYGYYEAIDYSRLSEPGGAAGIIIHCYMVHHQGMSLIALGNALHGQVMRNVSIPTRASALRSLSCTSIFRSKSCRPLVRCTRSEPSTGVTPIPGSRRSLRTHRIPRLHGPILSNGTCSVMVTNTGGGYLRWLDLDITRWRSDTTCDMAGPVCYIRDLGERNDLEQHPSTGPLTGEALHLEFHAGQSGVSAPERPVRNHYRDRDLRGGRRRSPSHYPGQHLAQDCRLELTSYLELALAPHKADRAHPAFNKLFIETEWLPHCEALLARRRPRSPDDRPVWVAHLMVPERAVLSRPNLKQTARVFLVVADTLETRRQSSVALNGSAGCVLDPIFSLRRRVTMAPNQRFQFALVTLVADRARRSSRWPSVTRNFAPRARLRDGVDAFAARDAPAPHPPGDVQIFQQLASHILFPQARLRPPPARLGRGRRASAALGARYFRRPADCRGDDRPLARYRGRPGDFDRAHLLVFARAEGRSGAHQRGRW